MSDDGPVLEIEERGPATGRRDTYETPGTELEDVRYFDPRNFRSPEQRERPFRVGVLLGGLGAVLVFFLCFGLVLFNSLLGGLAMFLICCLGWTALIGGRKWWMSDTRSPIDAVFDSFKRPPPPPPKIDEAPAQLARKRGDARRALSLYEGWRAEHPDLAILLFRMAELHHHDLKSPARARERYAEFVEEVAAKGRSATEEERTMAGYARVVLKDLDRSG